MSRSEDWSSFLSYVLSVTLAFSDRFVQGLDAHAAGIGAVCQIIGAVVVVMAYLWNKKCQIKRNKYYEQHILNKLKKGDE